MVTESMGAVVLPRREHGISRSRIDPDALKVLYRLHNSGFKAYLVGGSVRDLLLGKVPRDFDIGTDAHPNQVRRLFRNCRVIGRRFRLAHILFAGGKIVEVATFRRLADPSEDLTPDQKINFNTFGTPAEDARRRDLTINGLFYDIATFSVIDYVGGLQDLKHRVIRTIKGPAASFQEDPVRIIRVIRHAARNDFRVEPVTWREVMARQSSVMGCSMDRVREEFYKDLKSGSLAAVLELFHASGFLYSLFPEFEMPGRGRFADRIDFLHRLMEAASTIDRQCEGGATAPDVDLLLAQLFLPYFSLHAWRAHPRAEQSLVTYLLERMDTLLEPVFQRIKIPGDTRKRIRSRILLCERIRQAIHSLGSIPAPLRARPFFEEGLALYRADLERRGEAFREELLAGETEGKQEHPRKRRRRFHRGRGRGAPVPSAARPPRNAG
ncbi:MAG: poly(A) polymerase [Acidobacteria bacterium]|nr:poly(A) polymerase [Acidobacteriota bacterium]